VTKKAAAAVAVAALIGGAVALLNGRPAKQALPMLVPNGRVCLSPDAPPKPCP
jgi:hypothetical protein